MHIDGSIKGQNMKFNGIIIFQGCNLVQGNIICVLPLMINNECINMGRIGTWMHNIGESIESRLVDASPTTHEWVRLYKILGDTILEWVAKAGYMTNYWLAMLRAVLFSSKKFPLVSQSPPPLLWSTSQNGPIDHFVSHLVRSTGRLGKSSWIFRLTGEDN